MGGLWQGSWQVRLRIASGLVLFAFALTHFLNIALGIVSQDLLLRAQIWRVAVTRSPPGTALLYAALAVHMALALYGLARRRTLRMPLREAAQLVLGLTIPFLLAGHVVFTRYGHAVFGLDDSMAYLIPLIFGTTDGWMQALLLLVVWVHAMIGLAMWLNRSAWWRPASPFLLAGAVLVPALALVGFLVQGRSLAVAVAAAPSRGAYFARFGFPGRDEVAGMMNLESVLQAGFLALLLAALAVMAGRRLLARRQQVRVRYVEGPEVLGRRGLTLLEISREAAVPHASQCGGRGRCTTCRVVVVEGAERLTPPGEAEARSLRAVGAGQNTRLACQIRPSAPLMVYRVFRPDGRQRQRSETGFGQERRLAILFLDIRGFTARTTGVLPYDVVFLLNRFFDAIVPAIRAAGGQVDKYLGDGLLALFEAQDQAASARAALRATGEIGAALAAFNQTLEAEGGRPIRIGLGVHLGDLVLGEIGAAGNAPHTIIGEAVNAASRLEAMTKEMGVEALVSAAVLQAAGLALDSLPLKAVELRGVPGPVLVLSLDKAETAAGLLAPEPALAGA